MSDMTPEKAQALLDGATPYWRKVDTAVHIGLPRSYEEDDGRPAYGGFDLRHSPRPEANAALAAAAPDLARAYIAQAAHLEKIEGAYAHQAYSLERAAAELTRLRAKVDAADKLAEALTDTSDLSLTGEIPDGYFEDDAPDFNRGYDAAIRQVRAALSAYEGEKG